jgi:hypothetical protein
MRDVIVGKYYYFENIKWPNELPEEGFHTGFDSRQDAIDYIVSHLKTKRGEVKVLDWMTQPRKGIGPLPLVQFFDGEINLRSYSRYLGSADIYRIVDK